jgi:hypothetical protein
MAYNSSNPGGDDDMLSDSSPETSAEADNSESEDTSGKTFLMPESVCPGMGPGDKLVSEVKEVQDGQYLCEYTSKKGGEKSEPATESSSDSGDKEMASYMT